MAIEYIFLIKETIIFNIHNQDTCIIQFSIFVLLNNQIISQSERVDWSPLYKMCTSLNNSYHYIHKGLKKLMYSSKRLNFLPKARFMYKQEMTPWIVSRHIHRTIRLERMNLYEFQNCFCVPPFYRKFQFRNLETYLKHKINKCCFFMFLVRMCFTVTWYKYSFVNDLDFVRLRYFFPYY